MQIQAFMQRVRRNFKLNSSEALFLFTRNNHILSPQLTMKEAFYEFAGNDFLYLTLKKESTFG